MLFAMRFLFLLMVALPGFVAAQAPGITGIAHIAIHTTDLPRSVDFYQKLGFEQAFDFHKDNITLEAFLKINDRQFLEIYPALTAGFMHVCFESADMAKLNWDYQGLSPTRVKRAGAGNLLFTMTGPEQQNIEFTQYMAGSRHTNDQGKHLGEHRISDRILGVMIPMKDPVAAKSFYERKLQFSPSQQMVSFGSTFELLFAVTNLRSTAARLNALQIRSTRQGANLTIHDPDGNQIVFVGIQPR
jgi:catechol 2,3-dioxygenase-like lactoylglutathione lyase family enzyme